MATFYPPGSSRQITVTRHGCNSIVVDDAIEIARMEGLEGLGVVLGNQLMLPPGVPPAGQGLTTLNEYRKRLVMFYSDIFREASYRRFRSVFLPKLLKGNHDDLMINLLVQALNTFELADASKRLHPTLNEFVILCAETDYEHILCCLTTLFKAVASARTMCENSVRQQTPAENARGTPPSPHPPSSQSQSAAGQSGECSNQSRPARSPWSGSHFAFNLSSFPSAAVDFSQGSTILLWMPLRRYQNASQWRAPRHRRINTGGSRRGHYRSGGTWTQFYHVYDQHFEVQTIYLASRRTDGMTGRQDYRDPPCIRRCHYTQRTEDFRVNCLDDYITDRSPRLVGRCRKRRRNTSKSPRRDQSDGETSATDGEMTRSRDRGTATELEGQALRRQRSSTPRHVVEEESSQDSDDDKCAVCLAAMRQPTRLRKCDHVFCRQCLETSFSHRQWCPLCRRIITVPKGNMPDGTMRVSGHPASLPGHKTFSTVIIEYDIHDGLQQDNHPNPGVPFQGTRRTAYLPASEEGFMVCRLLWVAFQFRRTFNVGYSVTTGRDNVVVWNIRHKTRKDGGPQAFGYPDPDYLRFVTTELGKDGITEEFIQGFDIPF